MNIPPRIDRITLKDGSQRYRVRVRIKQRKSRNGSTKTLASYHCHRLSSLNHTKCEENFSTD